MTITTCVIIVQPYKLQNKSFKEIRQGFNQNFDKTQQKESQNQDKIKIQIRVKSQFQRQFLTRSSQIQISVLQSASAFKIFESILMSAEKAKIIDEKLSVDPFTYWPAFDVNGNGYLSLAEVDKGIRDVIQLPELFALKPVIIRAFNAAKTALKAKSSVGDDYVSKAEFKYLIQYLKDYTSYWIVFNEIDTSQDRRISLNEFQKAVPSLNARGLKIPDAKKAFDQIDTNNGGKILFDEFCHWVLKNHLQA